MSYHGWYHSCDKGVGEFFHMAPGFLQKTEPVCLYAVPYLHGVLCWDQQCPELQCVQPVLPLQ